RGRPESRSLPDAGQLLPGHARLPGRDRHRLRSRLLLLPEEPEVLRAHHDRSARRAHGIELESRVLQRSLRPLLSCALLIAALAPAAARAQYDPYLPPPPPPRVLVPVGFEATDGSRFQVNIQGQSCATPCTLQLQPGQSPFAA